ncbi:nucleotidyltransferase domain-containing protein [Kitasatospora sp. NPDC087861]|uniref:nucleotidyltransferase domain-containing protein n=1 Tax=Kitasatospora sp. NPDC087861 TaxID=3364070 RepID=UPI0038190F67
MAAEGLDDDGFIAREGSLGRVRQEFAPVVDSARALIAETFDRDRLHSAYLYGSIPRGTATPAVSDLDLLLALRREPTGTDRSDADALEAALDASFPQVNGVGILLFSTSTLLSDLERHDLGWFLACLCTPLLGDDLATDLPRYRPTTLLARETNGDLGLALPQWRERRAAGGTDAERESLSRIVSRRIVRTGLTLVMPRWGGWTSDLTRSAEVFGRYYPERAAQMRRAAAIARTPTADLPALDVLIDDLGPWLAAEYAAVHGEKAPRT